MCRWEMSKEEKTRRQIIEHAYDYQIALTEESDRAAAILAAAYFEDRLRDAIMTRFVALNGVPTVTVQNRTLRTLLQSEVREGS